VTGAEMALAFENWANGASKEERAKFVEHLTSRTHRTIQQRCMTVFVGCIEAWAECLDSKRFDPRNEATCKLAKKFCEGSGDKYDRQLPYI
jgi:hypothetical protein